MKGTPMSPDPNVAQTPSGSAHSSVLPTGGGQALLDPSDTVILLLDHQAGLFQTVKDIGVAELRSNVAMLAKLAKLMKIPVITTASEPNGTNGPLMPEIHQFAPHAVYVPRKGEVNAWDNEDFVKTVRAVQRLCAIAHPPPRVVAPCRYSAAATVSRISIKEALPR
jgi:nicotinamidase-related amidase